MNSAETILNTLGEELDEYIKPSRGYQLQPTIKYGVYAWNQVDAADITLCYADAELEFDEHLGDAGNIWLKILLYGYAPSDGISDTSLIRKLALDTLKFLFADFSYSNQSEITSNITLLPAQEGRPVSMFSLEFRVLFDYTFDNINT